MFEWKKRREKKKKGKKKQHGEKEKGIGKIVAPWYSVLKWLQVQDVSLEKQAFQAVKGTKKERQKMDQGTRLFACGFDRVPHMLYLYPMSC